MPGTLMSKEQRILRMGDYVNSYILTYHSHTFENFCGDGTNHDTVMVLVKRLNFGQVLFDGLAL